MTAIACSTSARISVSSRCLQTNTRERLRVYAFEPIPPIRDVLTANLRLHQVNAQVFPCGLAAQPSEATFAFYERNSAMSGRYWNPDEERRLAKTILLNKFPEVAENIDELVGDSFTPEYFTCQLTTISEVIDSHHVGQIDLLKVDVEKSELDVLDGIEARHWPLIRQVVVEVHSIDDRVTRIQRLLKRHGFRATVVQDRYFDGTGLCDIHAVRPQGGQTS
jgi:FkbM family methyltransferase